MNKKSSNKRWRLVADSKLQGNLCIRVAIYWFLCQLTIYGTMFGFAYLEGSETNDLQHLMIPALIASLVLLPAVVVDMISFSNRFAGPLHNFRRRFEVFAKTGEIEEIRFRKGDFFPDLQENFNQLRCRKPDVESQCAVTVKSDERVSSAVG